MFRASIIMALAIMVSGALPLLVQGYAWLDMARKAGGMEQLAAVMTDADPCCICDLARDLNDSSRSNEKTPFSSKSIDLLKNMEPASTELSLSAAAAVDSTYQFPIPEDALRLTGQSTSPATPPPRRVATFS